MLPFLLLVAVASSTPDPQMRVAAAQPALATVRIVRGAPIQFGSDRKIEESVVRQAKVRERDGTIRPASLVEFY